MNPVFKISRFSCPNNPFFQENIKKNKTNFKKLADFFRNIYLKFFKIFNFMEPLYISREISDEFYYGVEKFIKKPRNCLDREGILEMR